MVDFLESDDEDDSSVEDSEDRYSKLKKEEAGTNQDQAEKRFQELKEKAKEEFIQRQKQREEEDEDEESEEDNFVTY